MSPTADEPSRSAPAVAQPLAVITIWAVAFVASRRFLRTRRENES